ncbi:MAG TPA: extracellular solute-binding protein [Longilinea sp.]|nr:extracellular solute-binding protein [Longilinea sp.]
MKNSKVFVVLTVLLTAGMLLGACAPAATPTEAPAAAATSAPAATETATTEPVTITFWHAYNADTETPFLEKTVIPAFEAANPGITVQDVDVPYDQFQQKLITAMAGGTAPDVARLDIIWVPQFAQMGALANLGEDLPDFNTLKDTVFPGPLSTNYYQGNYYGLPLDTNTRVLFYNQAMFDAAGITEPPATIDDFTADCAKIKALGADKYCYADGGTYGWAVDPWIWSFGGDMTDPTYTTSTGYFNSADTAAAYQFLKDGVDKGYIDPGIKGGGVDTWGGFGKGTIAMILDGPWFPPSFKSQFPDVKYGMALMPAGKGGSVSVVGGEDIVMFQQSKNKEAAAKFIDFMLSIDTQMQMASVGQMPVLKAANEGDNLAKLPDYFGIFFKQLENAKARTPVSNWTKIEQIISDAGTAILNGTTPVQQSLDGAVTQIDPLLKQ